HLDASFGGLHEEGRDGAPAEGGLEGKIKALFDRPLQQPHALAPGCAVGVGLSEGRVFLPEAAGRFVRIEILASVLMDGRAADAALPRPIDAGQYMNAWPLGGGHAARWRERAALVFAVRD